MINNDCRDQVDVVQIATFEKLGFENTENYHGPHMRICNGAEIPIRPNRWARQSTRRCKPTCSMRNDLVMKAERISWLTKIHGVGS
jgi:hypothetical protein